MSGSATNRLPAFNLEALDPGRRALVDEIMSGRGRLPTPFRVWIANPELAKRIHSLGQFLTDGRGLSLSKAEVEIAVLTTARRWNSEYVLATHTKEAQAAGLDESTIVALKTEGAVHSTDPRQQALADLMAALAADSNPSPKVFDDAILALGTNGIAEALMIVGYFTAVSLAMKVYDVPLPG
jgi:4-carboxymuconolactone decarboxylase